MRTYSKRYSIEYATKIWFYSVLFVSILAVLYMSILELQAASSLSNILYPIKMLFPGILVGLVASAPICFLMVFVVVFLAHGAWPAKQKKAITLVIFGVLTLGVILFFSFSIMIFIMVIACPAYLVFKLPFPSIKTASELNDELLDDRFLKE